MDRKLRMLETECRSCGAIVPETMTMARMNRISWTVQSFGEKIACICCLIRRTADGQAGMHAATMAVLGYLRQGGFGYQKTVIRSPVRPPRSVCDRLRQRGLRLVFPYECPPLWRDCEQVDLEGKKIRMVRPRSCGYVQHDFRFVDSPFGYDQDVVITESYLAIEGERVEREWWSDEDHESDFVIVVHDYDLPEMILNGSSAGIESFSNRAGYRPWSR